MMMMMMLILPDAVCSTFNAAAIDADVAVLLMLLNQTYISTPMSDHKEPMYNNNIIIYLRVIHTRQQPAQRLQSATMDWQHAATAELAATKNYNNSNKCVNKQKMM